MKPRSGATVLTAAIVEAGSAVRAAVRAAPVTTCYLAALVLAHMWLVSMATEPDAVLRAVSTNEWNLERHPLTALFGSLVFFDGPLTPATTEAFAGTVIAVAIGVGFALGWLESRRGIRWAYGSFIGGHILATLLTLAVIRSATHDGRYPTSVLTDLDYGVSYGAETAMAAITFAMPRRFRPFWALFVVSWPIAGATWYGFLPDFTTVGHLFSAMIGFLVGAVAFRNRDNSPAGPYSQRIDS